MPSCTNKVDRFRNNQKHEIAVMLKEKKRWVLFGPKFKRFEANFFSELLDLLKHDLHLLVGTPIVN